MIQIDNLAFSYGSKENGAVFCHMAVMYAFALYSRGFASEGWRVLEQLYSHCADFRRSKILPGIPEYFDERGQGMYPYLTGSGSWLLLTVQTQLFGVRGQDGDLVLEPKLLPCHFDASGTAEIHCVSAGHELTVCYHNPLGLEYGSFRIGTASWETGSAEGNGAKLVISRSELPTNGPLRLDVTLVPCN